jgi:hypothetical protein
MSVVKKFLFGAAGAAVLATGAASSVHAQAMYVATDPCDMYAREYAAVNAPHFGPYGWDSAYRHAYNECLTGGPTFLSGPYTGPLYSGPFAPVDTAATLAGAALAAPLSVAGAAVTAGADIATGTAAALASPFDPALDPEFAPEPVAPASGELNPPIHPTMSEPVVMRNFRGSFELE